MSALSPSDRALIDAAIAAGVVRVIPRGVSGLPEVAPLSFAWTCRKPKPRAVKTTERKPRVNRPRVPSNLPGAHVKRMNDLRAKGYTFREIAQITGRAVALCHACVTVPKGAGRPRAGSLPQWMIARIRELRAEGATIRTIAAEMEIGVSTVHRHLERAGEGRA